MKKKAPYFNRELSWLAFNRRVLEQAENESFPILERVKFLSFVCSNLDEFFEIRVAGIMQEVESNVTEKSMDGLTPQSLLTKIQKQVAKLVKDKYNCWHNMLVPEMEKNGIHIKSVKSLNDNERIWLRNYFEEEVFPVLTPLAIDLTHPFPQIGNKTLNLIVRLQRLNYDETDLTVAVIPVPRILSRIVQIEPGKKKKQHYIFLSDILKLFAHRLFPGYKIIEVHAFRITRNSDLYVDVEEVENLLTKIEEELWNLRKNDPVRLEIEAGVSDKVLSRLIKRLELQDEHVYKIDGPLNLMRLRDFSEEVSRPKLEFPNFVPYIRPPLNNPESIFSILSKEEILLHHPYESFTPVIEFIEQAARDPQVFAIKQTLYRTSGDSPIIKALKEASINGKQVTALIELKARFDEANNIQWARELEEAGVHVVYGLAGLKTHCKCCLVVRREREGLKRYAHLGTGNYNPKTSRVYTDLSFFTERDEITREVAELFNSLTGFARSPRFNTLLVAPFNLKNEVNRLIRLEADNAREGKPAKIIVKVNSLIDQETIDNLYTASMSGVQITLIIRGICGLVPGVKGISENIRVISILGRFLEHSRIYYFENGDNESLLFAGSADWMPRNFVRRIECVFPIRSQELRKRIVDDILLKFLADNKYAKELQSDGSYTSIDSEEPAKWFSAQDHFMGEVERQRSKLN